MKMVAVCAETQRQETLRFRSKRRLKKRLPGRKQVGSKSNVCFPRRAMARWQWRTISDNAQVNLTDDNNGFANGVLWIEAFENPVRGTSLLDIRDNGVLTIHGEWWTDENSDGVRGIATQTEADYFQANYIDAGWIVGNGGADPVDVSYARGVITMRVVPEPASLGFLFLALPLFVRLWPGTPCVEL